MKDAHGIIIATNINPQLKELTNHRTVASLPFGGRYRVIDFTLSNMINAGISDVGVVMWRNYQSLLDHLGSGRDWDLNRKLGGLRLLPPFGFAQRRNGSDHIGKMEALAGVFSYVKRIKQPIVVMSSGELIANLPLEEIIVCHEKSGHDITVVCAKKPVGNLDTCAYLSVDEMGRVTDVSVGDSAGKGLSALGLYVFERPVLEKLVVHCQSHNLTSLRRDVLLKMHKSLSIGTYMFDGYAANPSSIQNYFQCNMELLDPNVRHALFDRRRAVRTKVRDEASTYYGESSTVKNSFVADGCYIEGEAINSILFRGVRVEKGAKVQNSILMQDTEVKSGASLNYAITDKEVVVNPGRILMGHDSYPIAISKGSRV